jgi:DNA polymerase
VNAYRETNRRVVRAWFDLEEQFRACDRGTFYLYLPSGRYLRYFDVDAKNMTASTRRGGPPEKIFGGRLLENKVQATARDIMASAWLYFDKLGLRVVLTVHDEFVIEAQTSNANEVAATVRSAMTSPPMWAPGLPLAAAVTIAQEYGK